MKTPATLRRNTALSLAAAVAAVLASHSSHAAAIQFSAATTISADTDVFNVGGLSYAYDWANSTQTVNGVTFTATNATAPGGNVTLTNIASNNTTAFTSGAAPFSGLSAAYRAMLVGAEFNAGAAGTVTLNNLALGHVYATQFWVNDPRPIAGRSETITSGGNTVTLTYSAANVAGSPGQFTIGTFTADTATQAMNLVSTGGSTQINAIQLRDVTGVWSGATNGTWDGGTANFTGGQIFATVSGLSSSVFFADTDGFKNAVTNNVVTVAAGGVSIGTVSLQNSALAYTFNSADATGITGATSLSKTGTGIVNLAGANTFTGTTTVSAGSLVLKHTAALQNSTLTTAGVVFDSSVGANAFTLGGLSGSGAISLLNNAAAAVNLSIGKNSANTTYSGALSGAGGALTKIGNGTLTLSSANSYTGATLVSAGKLSVTGSLNTGSAISVNANATLAGTGTVGAATVAAGGIIEAGVGGAGKLTLSGLTFSGAGTVNIGFLSNYAAATGVQVTGAGLLNPTGGANSVTVNVANTAGITLGVPYKLIGNTGGVSAGAFSAFQLSALPGRGVGALNNTAGEITLTVSSTDAIKWTGAGTLANGWDTATQNWKLSSNNDPTSYIDTPGDSVIFDDDAAPGNTIVNLGTANFSPNSVLFNNTTNSYTLQGAFGFGGLTTLSKTGTGTTTLATSNSYTGATTVSQGALNIQHANALGATGANTVVTSGAALQIQNNITTAAEPLTLNGTGITATGALRNIADNNTYTGLVTLGSTGVRINSDAGTLTLSNTGTITGSGFALTVGGAGNTTINSIIGTGAGTLTKDGNGTLILAATNTYTGATLISAGTLQVGNGPTGSLAAGSTITNNSSLVFFRDNAAVVDPAGVITGPGTVAYNGPGVAVVNQGQFTVGDVNTYTGPTAITNTRVQATNAAAFGTGAGAIVTVNSGGQIYCSSAITINNPAVINGIGWLEAAGNLGAIRMQAGTYAGTVTMASDSRISSYSGSGTISGVISGAFNLETFADNNTRILTFSGVNTYTGATTITNGILSVATIGDGGVAGNLGAATDAPANIVLNGGVLRYSGASAGTNRNLTIANGKVGNIEVFTAATNLTLNGFVDFSTGGLMKLGGGTLTLKGANGYLGATTVSAGTLALDGGGTITNTADFTIGNTTTTGATFNLANGAVSLSGANVLSASVASTPTTTIFTYNQTGGTFDYTNPAGFMGISNNGGTTNISVSTGNFTAYNTSGMNLGVRGDGNLTVSGSGTVTLPTLTFGHPSTTGGNSTVVLNGGTLEIGAGRIVKASGTATMNFNGGILKPTVASPTFLNGLNNTNVRNGGVIIDTNNLDITIGQSLLHSAIGGDNAVDGGLTKNNNGVLTLSGINNYTGPTNVTGGKLVLTGSLFGAGTVAVAGGTTFGGSGSAGTATVAGGGTIEAGAGGAGQLVLTGLTFSGAANLNVGTLAGYAATPALQVSGLNALNPTGGNNSVTISVANLTGATVGNTYKLIGYAGAIGTSGFPAFTLAALPNRGTGTLADAGNEIRLTLNTVDSVKWTGAGTLANGWETATQNWKLASNNSPTNYIDAPADAVIFDDDANIANTTVDVITANVSPVSVTFANATKDYVLQGTYSITGATGVTKNGAALVTISNTNTYTGATTINQGSIKIQNGDALGSASNGTTVESGAALQVQGGITVAEPITLKGTGVADTGAMCNVSDLNTYTGLVTLGGNTRINSVADTLTLSNPGTITGSGFGLIIGGAGNTTINSIIGTGGGNFVKDGAGTATLTGANTFTGGVLISEGVLITGNALALGGVGNTITITSGGALDINGQTLQGYTSHIFLSGPGAASSPTLGALGNGPAGVQNLNTIRDIELTGDTSLGGDGGRWDIGRIDFNANPAITVDHITGNGFTITKVGSSYLGLLTGASNLAGFIVNGGIVAPHENTSFGAGPVTVNTGGTVKPWGGPTFANDFTLAGGTLTEQDGFTDTYNGAISVTAATTSTLQPVNGNILLNGNVTGTGGLLKNDAFSLFLNGDNSGFTGTYQNDVSNTFFSAATAGSASAAFTVNGGNLAGRATGTYTVDLGSLAGTGGQVGNDTAGSAVTFSIGGDGTDTTYSGAILDTVGGGGTTAITKVGAGELTLSGTLSYTGVTNIDDGKLHVNSALGGGANIVNANGGNTYFGVSETLAELNIGADAVVTLGAAAAAPATAFGAVPEPGTASLLLLGALGLLGWRRRA